MKFETHEEGVKRYMREARQRRAKQEAELAEQGRVMVDSWYRVSKRNGTYWLSPWPVGASMVHPREMSKAEAEKLLPMASCRYYVEIRLTGVGCSFGRKKWYWVAKAAQKRALVENIQGPARWTDKADATADFQEAAKQVGINARSVKYVDRG